MATAGGVDAFQALDGALRQVNKSVEDAAVQLDAAFEYAPSSPSAEGGVTIRPLELLARLRELERAMPALLERIRTVSQRKQAVMATLQEVVPRAQQSVQAVCAAAGTPVGAEARTQASQFVAMVAPSGGDDAETVWSAASGDLAEDTARSAGPETRTASDTRPAAGGAGVGAGAGANARSTTRGRRGSERQSSRSQPAPPSLPSRRNQLPSPRRGGKRTSRKLSMPAIVPQPCEEGEFEALPSTVRGRCKFADIVKVYGLVCEHARNELKELLEAAGTARRRAGVKLEEIPPMTIKQLSTAGAKVTGHTGSCVLNALRTMGLIQVSRGRVSLAHD